jgi:REP element-mobilizing transposase RayT
MPRQAKLDFPGALHHVIIRGVEKQNIVDGRRDREIFLSRMGELASETKTVIYAWALMTNHAHILLRSGPQGISKFMRRLLTGYATKYNLHHGRSGNVFQNRYKSIVCDEDFYFRELVRYIHLNPLRAKLVNDMGGLDKYPWCGHSVLMGKIKNGWQDRNHVLSWFGTKEGEAKRAYRQYVKKGIALGKRPNLVGGGLVRSVGGWSEVKLLRGRNQKVLTDERILGSGNFVKKTIKEADRTMKKKLLAKKGKPKAGEFIQKICKKEKIRVRELRMGGRRRPVSRMRAEIAYKLVEDFGLTLAEAARQLGVSASGIYRAINRSSERE